MHFETFTNMFPCGGNTRYKNFPMRKMTTEIAMRAAGTPKASGKQSVTPKHSTSSLRIGVTEVEMKDPRLMAK